MGIRGTVVRVSNIKPLVTKLCFVCVRCSTRQQVHLPDGMFRWM